MGGPSLIACFVVVPFAALPARWFDKLCVMFIVTGNVVALHLQCCVAGVCGFVKIKNFTAPWRGCSCVWFDCDFWVCVLVRALSFLETCVPCRSALWAAFTVVFTYCA